MISILGQTSCGASIRTSGASNFNGEAAGEACFLADTLVHTNDGLKPIEDIRVGDLVLSFPEDETLPAHPRTKEELYFRAVTETFVQNDQPFCELTYANPGERRPPPIRVTPGHPIFTKRRSWTSVCNLQTGDVVFNSNFGGMVVTGVSLTKGIARVHNIEVSEHHTYYVAKSGLWVHNTHLARSAVTPSSYGC